MIRRNEIRSNVGWEVKFSYKILEPFDTYKVYNKNTATD